jgi:hypothetical protein
MSHALLGERRMAGFCATLMSLEVLNLAFVLESRRSGLESAEIAPAFSLRIYFARIQPIFAAADLANHPMLLSLWGLFPSTSFHREFQMSTNRNAGCSHRWRELLTIH